MNNKGRNTDNAVPRKLAKGMAVVVWLKPSVMIAWDDTDASIKHNCWLKGEIVGFNTDGWWVVRIKGCIVDFQTHEAIIIRSTSYADNGQAYHTKRNKRTYAARKAVKELGKFNQFADQ